MSGDLSTTSGPGAALFDAGVSAEMAVYRSDLIAVGAIIEITEPRWTTTDGKAPKDVVYGDTPPEPQIIYRVATVRVTETLHGEAPATLRVSLVGTGDRTGPEAETQGEGWKAGDEVVLYLAKASAESRIVGADWALVQGLLVEGRLARARNLPASMTDMALADLAARVRSEQARKATGAQEPVASR